MQKLERAFSHLFALLLYPHLLKRGMKLPDEVMFSIGVPVPNCALEETHTHVHSFRAQLQQRYLNEHTQALAGMQGNAMLND